MGCGSGRWAKFVAPLVGFMHCVDASRNALEVAKDNLSDFQNVDFICATPETSGLGEKSQDFGYSLGVLHHIPDTQAALNSCVNLLKIGAPFLIYIYYKFDNRPIWYKFVWQVSELLRGRISRLPPKIKNLTTDCIAALIYFPLARCASLLEKLGINLPNFPLYAYRNLSFYTMRTDSRDRFGTPLEKRFTRDEIKSMMEIAGLNEITFSDRAPYWCAVGVRAR